MQWIYNQTQKRSTKEEHKKHWYFQKKEKDSNAINIDTMTTEKRADMMRKGQCFGCQKPGHLNKDCPDKKKQNNLTPVSYASTWATTSNTPKKTSPNELTAHIQSLMALMSVEEKKVFMTKRRKSVFNPENHIDIDLSYLRYFLCKRSNNPIEFTIYIDHNKHY